MIFVPNLRRKSFRLYLETEIETEYLPSLIRDEIKSVFDYRRTVPSLNRDVMIFVPHLRRKSFRLYIETEIETELSVSNQRRIFSVSD